jgi:hypothetical protein
LISIDQLRKAMGVRARLAALRGPVGSPRANPTEAKVFR